MRILTRALLITIAALIALAIAFVAIWDIPPPPTKIERVLPDDRFPR